MYNLTIEKFNPQKSELLQLVDSIKNTVISIPGDKTGYQLMKENKTVLQKKRTELTKMFKDERAGALAYQKGIIEIEKEILSIISPVESELDARIKEIDDENERERRRKVLPDRVNKLAEIDLAVPEEQLLELSEAQFISFFNEAKENYLREKELKIRLAEEEREAERQAKIQAEENERQAKLKAEEAERQAKIKEENDKLEAERARLRAEQDKIDAENARIKKEQEDKEREIQIQKERADAAAKATEDEKIRVENERRAAEEKLRLEKLELEKQKRYQKFLSDNEFNANTDMMVDNGVEMVLYRRINSFRK